MTWLSTNSTKKAAVKYERTDKTIVAGTTFGQFYCEAMKGLSDADDFCGILAAGSKRSVDCAKRYVVKMYTSVDDLPEDIGLACVVTRSGYSAEMVLSLQRRFSAVA